MIFSVISIDQGAGDTDNAKIIQYGPPNIDIVAKTSYEEMLGLTGWNITQKIDQSAQFLESIKIHLKDIRRKKADLAPELGDEDYKFSNEKYTTYLDCISRGVMRRDIYIASPG